MTTNVASVMKQLEKLGTEQTRKTFRNHGAQGDLFGVKVGDLKKLLKQLRGEQALAMELWETNNSDAMYLASFIADGQQMTSSQLNQWAKTAWWSMLSDFAVPYVAAEHAKATQFAIKWMKSKQESVAACGWATYSLAVAVRSDDTLDLEEIKGLLKFVELNIHSAPNQIRSGMNNFVISIGCYVKPLLAAAKATANKIGKVDVDVGKTSCKIPLASSYIAKVESMGRIGRKRSSTRC
jgi:3-methyladenine DNA glycosylase AlkD